MGRWGFGIKSVANIIEEIMKKLFLFSLFLNILFHTGEGEYSMWLHADQKSKSDTKIIILPEPKYTGETSIEEVLFKRRSIRDFKDEPLTLKQISQLLWAAQGITDKREGFRTAPSAGALYPLEVYLVSGNITDLPIGIYKYNPDKHELTIVTEQDVRLELGEAALGQSCVKEGAAVIVLAAVYERTTRKYGKRGIRYAHIEVGNVSQNIYLQAVSLNLGTVVVGAFDDEQVKKVMQMETDEEPLCVMPVGIEK